MKNKLIKPAKSNEILICCRDPAEGDEYEELTIWVSKEYFPYRIFEMQNGKWKFLGKFISADSFLEDKVSL